MKMYVVWWEPVTDCGHDVFQGIYTTKEKAIRDFPAIKKKYSSYDLEKIEVDKEYDT